MFFAIQETPYDLKWRMFGIHVRVHPLFWLVAAIFSWVWVQWGVQHILISMACIFLSILIHELGHVVVGKCFGSHGHIVLWAMGGLAIGSNQLDSRWKRVAVLLAGPFAQFLLLAIVWAMWPRDHIVLYTEGFGGRLVVGVEKDSVWYYLVAAYVTLLFVNLVWPILNLLPIWPLDGGQISREWFTYFSPRNGVRFSLHLSIGVALLLALHILIAWKTERGIIPYINQPFNAVFFGVLAAMGYQALQAENERTRWFDPWDHERW
ncbi:MAG TPA: site-2 protease family protein [Gemmataceae bacterium]|nr:site-2 protease family protein [Gemmataceae bacterium]